MDFINLWDWVQTLTVDDLPAGTLHPAPQRMVIECDKPRWLSIIQRDAKDGPKGPRGRTGAIQEDLRYLYELVGKRD